MPPQKDSHWFTALVIEYMIVYIYIIYSNRSYIYIYKGFSTAPSHRLYLEGYTQNKQKYTCSPRGINTHPKLTEQMKAGLAHAGGKMLGMPVS